MAISFTDQLAAVGGNLVRSWDFISEAQSFGTENFGDNVGILDNGYARPQIDTSIKPPGTSGSLKFTIPSLSGANTSGSWWMNFSTDLSVQFGANQTFYYSWWQRFHSFFIAYDYDGGGGWKQVIMSAGDKPGCSPGNTSQCMVSCTALELVNQNTQHRGFPQMYQSCTGCVGTGGHVGFAGFEESIPPTHTNFKLQNSMPDPFCLYSGPADYPGCFHYFADEWMQFQVKVVMGARDAEGWLDSHVDCWVARPGQVKQQLFNWVSSGSYMLCGGLTAEALKYGKIWLLPYNTNKNIAEAHTESYTWYAGVIVSTAQIPMHESEIEGSTDSKLVVVFG